MISKNHLGSWTHAFNTITISMLLRMCTASASLRPSVWTSVKSVVQSRNCSCPGRQFGYKMPTSSGPTRTRSTIVTETPRDDWRVLWRTVVLLPPCTLVRLVAFGYKYGLRSDLRAPNFINFSGGACPQTPPSVCVLMHAPSSVPPPQISSTFHCLWNSGENTDI